MHLTKSNIHSWKGLTKLKQNEPPPDSERLSDIVLGGEAQGSEMASQGAYSAASLDTELEVVASPMWQEK